jgi:hypothetical protein
MDLGHTAGTDAVEELISADLDRFHEAANIIPANSEALTGWNEPLVACGP